MSLDVEHHFHQQFPSSSSSRCDLHPNETVTGFCASCLRERLQGLEASAIANNPTAGRKSTSALKSVFYKLSGSSATNAGAQPPPPPPVAAQQPSFSELRRCKSFSFGRGAIASAFEPQRRSCDVRTTLSSLFDQDDKLRCRTKPVSVRNDGDDEIRPAEPVVVAENCREIEEETPENSCEIEEEPVEIKVMKEHIVEESQKKSNSDNSKPFVCEQTAKQFEEPAKKENSKERGSFWLAASVFSKKLQKWRRNYKVKKQSGSKAAAAAMPAPPKNSKFSRRFGDTQSEVAADVFGRRSCDTDPRFSLDAGRFSFDDPRFSWDEPRASWDGYMVGGRSVFPRLPPMLSVVEDAPVSVVQRSDGLIPVEEDVIAPGGSSQTKDYYFDSSSRRRRSLDRSTSIREQPLEFCEQRPVCNGAEHLHCYHGGFVDRDARDWSSNSLRDEYLGGFENAFEDPFKAGDKKKSRRWSKAWSILGFLQKRNSSRNANVVDRSFSESWTELQSRSFSGKLSRSDSSMSCRNSFSGSTASTRSRVNPNGYSKKRTGEFTLERNRSARFSPNQNDSGLLRFYLAPMRNSRRNGVSGNGQQMSSNYLSKSMLGLY